MKTSRHLAYLRRAGLVDTRRQGLWIYYRLVAPTDQVIGAVQHAVRHVLGHVTEVGRDVQRLHKKTGCCLPAQPDDPVLSCCADPRRSISIFK